MAATAHNDPAPRNSLSGNAFAACLATMALAMLTCAALTLTRWLPSAGAAAVGLLAGAVAAVPLSRWAVADDLERLTARLEQLGARLRHEESAGAAARRAAEESEAARAEFLSAMNHELRTPLNAVLGFGQVLGMTTLAPDQRECLDQVLRRGRHLLRLVNELLQISHIEGGRVELSPEPVLARDVIAEVLELAQPMAAHRRIAIDAAGLSAAP